MPPLIKGYLRLGAQFGRGCVIDREMGTVVVLVVLPIENLAERYVRHYTAREQPRSVSTHTSPGDRAEMPCHSGSSYLDSSAR